ncbi:MAG: response regulator transcription factor [Ruminococcus sp.]|nr:response regulator transcription factor [Ruminococcus sp.]
MLDKNFTVNIAVCDDDDYERNRIIELITKGFSKTDYIENIDRFVSGEDFLAADINKYDLVFMDIYMTGINGMETAKQLYSGNKRTKIVFCTTSSDFGVESYDVEAMRYLLKPIEEEKFFAVLDFFFKNFAAKKTITVKCDRIDETIALDDIIWIESQGHKSVIHTNDGEYTTRSSLAEFHKELEPYGFMKPVRYALVSISEVVGTPNKTMLLTDGTEFDIPKDKRVAIRNEFADIKYKRLIENIGS